MEKHTNKPILVGSGFITLDILIKDETIRDFDYYVGGSCGNVMMILSYLGWNIYPIARLGENKFSKRLVERLSNNNVHIDYITQKEDGSTPIIIQRNIVDKQGNHKHKFEIINPITKKYLPSFKSITKKTAIEIIESLPFIPKYFYFDRATPGILLLAKYFKENGSIVLFEPSSINEYFDKALIYTDILKYSSQRISDYKKTHIKSNIPIEIETQGEKGLEYRCNLIDCKWNKIPPYKIDNIIDTSGAGDWTTSAILYKMNSLDLNSIGKEDLYKLLISAQRVGAISCKYLGSRGLMGESVRFIQDLLI